MSLSDDEFGDGVDDADLLQVATQIEQHPTQSNHEPPKEPSPKRRRLNTVSAFRNDGPQARAPLAQKNSSTKAQTHFGNGKQRPVPQPEAAKSKGQTLGSFWPRDGGRDADMHYKRSRTGDNPYAEILADPDLYVPPGHDGESDHQHDAPFLEQDEPIEISSQDDYGATNPMQFARPARPMPPQGQLKQPTLYGGEAAEAPSRASQTRRIHNWPLAQRNEKPTHHELNDEALRTWVYPANLGRKRTYQYNIVSRALYHNLLVALPTGLGKTFIAAVIMLNWFRWTKTAQIVFLAPTKPLVSQQVDACFNIAGIPRSATTMLTGTTSPGQRAEEWNNKRVFFMTPQTFVNDVKTGICDPKRTVLIVVDEAHRATGSYSYVEAVKAIRRFNDSFRVLALTATPGSDVDKVQEVIDGLGISRVEIRTEESIDIREYVHARQIDSIIFHNSDDMVHLMDMFSKTLQPLVNKLLGINAYYNRDPMMLTPYGMNQALRKWGLSEAGRNSNMGVKSMARAVFTVLAQMAHAIDLLKFHGIGPFIRSLEHFMAESDRQIGKYRKQIVEDESFRKMLGLGQGWMRDTSFVGHPKLEHLQEQVLDHFVNASEGNGPDNVSPAHTRIMVFAHFRDSAEEIVRILKRHEPMIRPHVFVGQAAAKGSDGMGQKRQLEIVSKFKSGVYNTLVATSIGEEGLDIGEVDLIVCYDASASPIRMLQRMGRTGRKRAGNIVVLLMDGKEKNSFEQAKDSYQKMQRIIADGSSFKYHHNLAPRIVPQGVEPTVDERVIEIPVENSRADLPEPKKSRRPPKRPPKRFHMPDGVRTGFTKASRLAGPQEDDESDENDSTEEDTSRRRPRPAKARSPSVEPLPLLENVLLSATEEKYLERLYQQVAGDGAITIEGPQLDVYPPMQRQERPTGFVGHGAGAKRLIHALNQMHGQHETSFAISEAMLDPADKALIDDQFAARVAFAARPKGPKSAKPPPSLSLADDDLPSSEVSDGEGEAPSMDAGGYDDDLADFIDDGASSVGRREATASPVSTPSSRSPKEKPFFERTKLVSQQSMDMELPDVDDILGENTSTLIGKGTSSGRSRRAKRAVIDSDDDDDEE